MQNKIKTSNTHVENISFKHSLCPNCNTPLEESWEKELDEVEQDAGYEFEILECFKCGYKEAI
jgi:uncharacterized protein with PIN domain